MTATGATRLLHGVMAGALIMGLGGMGVGGCANRSSVDYVPLRHPFRGAALRPDPDSLAAHWQREHGADWLDPIVTTPQARWLTGPEDVERLAATARRPGQRSGLPVLVAYYIPNRDCAGPGQGAGDPAGYAAWIGRLVDTLAGTRAVVVLEPDAVAADCFDKARARALSGAVRALADAGHAVYLDAGHPRWRGPEEMAERLLAAGINRAEGFSVNVANRQSTQDSHRWAVRLSALVGDREAIIDTSRNGLPAPPDDQWCNPPRQGLGQPPTTQPGLERVAALLWVKRPGESDGACGGEPDGQLFSPRQAQTLIVNAPWVSEADRSRAAAARLPGA